MIHIDAIRKRVFLEGMIIDMDTIRKRVIHGDTVFSQRILLTALIKGDSKTREWILEELGPEHFGQAHFRHIFEWITRALQQKGGVDAAELYQEMESHVHNHWRSASDPDYDRSQYSVEDVLPGYMAVIDHLLAIETPDPETIGKAVAWLQKGHVWRKTHLRSP
ncbi:MAG: hypothetical protein ABIN58_07645 [candidate division WOR-3 bacterium]